MVRLFLKAFLLLLIPVACSGQNSLESLKWSFPDSIFTHYIFKNCNLPQFSFIEARFSDNYPFQEILFEEKTEKENVKILHVSQDFRSEEISVNGMIFKGCQISAVELIRHHYPDDSFLLTLIWLPYADHESKMYVLLTPYIKDGKRDVELVVAENKQELIERFGS